MRTALYLLGALGVATFVATLVPQRPNVPNTVARWLSGAEGPGAGAARMLDRLGLFDVFGAPWFLLLLVLLFTSLTSCLIPRYRAYVRTVRRGQPPRARELGTKPHVSQLRTAAPAEEALSVARALLRRRRFRVRRDAPGMPAEVAPTRADARAGVVPAPADAQELAETARRRKPAPEDGSAPSLPPQVASERGHLAREGGSLLFHTAFYLLLVGVVVGKLATFTGMVGVVEGQSFTDTPVAYWNREAGRWWGSDDHTGFVLTLDHFAVDWHPDGQPAFFRSEVTIDPGGGAPPMRRDLQVNVPAVVNGMKIHQLDWGYAVRVVVRDPQGEVVHDAFVPLSDLDGGGGAWRGVVKAPAAKPQLGFELFFVPTALEDRDGLPVPTRWPGAEAPLLLVEAWEGDLQLFEAQKVDRLDTRRMTKTATFALREGSETTLSGGATVAFPEVRRWSGLQVSRRLTDPLLLAAAATLLAGLLPALYAYRRRIWVEVTSEESGATLLTVAGHAFQRPQAFESEFASLVRALENELHVQPSRERKPTDEGPTPDSRSPREVARR
ncbi:MAG: cytochrome c biogenesis protein ResB [Actinomycetota bacterium]|nr:cytochrome c biogenesis protein ResB [Actinomycetota bacterium]